MKTVDSGPDLGIAEPILCSILRWSWTRVSSFLRLFLRRIFRSSHLVWL
jgi:hypothetical protein